MKNITKIASTPSHTSKLRVAAYCRVSTESDAQLESLETQKSHYERYIASRDDWEFAGIYYDEGISGTKKENRSELLRLMADCKAKKIDHIITKSISRFSRNTTDCLELIRKLLQLNVTVFFEKENINTGSMESELFLSVLSSMAQGESTSISDNIRWSVKQRFQNGTFKLSYPPYGYLWNGSNLVIDLKQANIIKRIFSDALSGKGAKTIAKELNAQNIPSKKDGRWTSSTILGILSNEKYVGDAVFQKTFTDENSDINDNLDADIFRNAYIFEVEDLSKFDQTIYEVEKIEGGAEISHRRDLVQSLNDYENIVAFLFACIMVFLFILSVFVIMNSVKASVYARKNEIAIMKYVGATDFFIRLPFFIEGLIIGIFSGIISNILLIYIYNAVISPILSEIDFISPVDISSGHFYLTLIFIICGGLIGMLGSVLPVKKYLKV